jgi:hypothetical protein
MSLSHTFQSTLSPPLFLSEFLGPL